VLVWETYGKGPNNENIVSSAPKPLGLQKPKPDRSKGIAIFDSAGRGYNLSATGGEPEQVSGLRVSANFFFHTGSAADARPNVFFAGRRNAWQRPRSDFELRAYGRGRYGGDTTIVGRTVKIDGEDFAVVGHHAARFFVAVLEQSTPTLGASGLYQDRPITGPRQ